MLPPSPTGTLPAEPPVFVVAPPAWPPSPVSPPLPLGAAPAAPVVPDPVSDEEQAASENAARRMRGSRLE